MFAKDSIAQHLWTLSHQLKLSEFMRESGEFLHGDKQFASICYSLSLRCGYFLSFYFVVLSSCVMFCFSRLHLSFSRLFPSSPVFHLLIGPVYLSSAFPVALCQIICSALSRVSALFSTVSFVSFRGLCSSPRAICFLCHLFMYQLIIKAFLVFFPGEISLNCVSGLRPALSLPPCLLLLLAITGYVRLDMLSGPFKWYKKKKYGTLFTVTRITKQSNTKQYLSGSIPHG